MPSLVEQLQRDAADPAVSVPTLLRRAKISAKKLGLKKVETWIEHELNGYSSDLPEYRKVSGRLMAWNPYRGWIPMMGEPEVISTLSQTSTAQSVDELQSLLDQQPDGTLAVELNPRLTGVLNGMVEMPMPRYVVRVERSALVGIMNAVRNAVLEWALSLEEHDITGTTFSFTPEEKQIAREQNVAIRIDNIGSFVGNLGSKINSGDIQASDVDVKQVQRLVGQIKPAIKSEMFNADERRKITPLVQALDAESGKSKPDSGKIAGLLNDVRNALSSASGNLIASGLIHEISKLFMPS